MIIILSRDDMSFSSRQRALQELTLVDTVSSLGTGVLRQAKTVIVVDDTGFKVLRDGSGICYETLSILVEKMKGNKNMTRISISDTKSNTRKSVKEMDVGTVFLANGDGLFMKTNLNAVLGGSTPCIKCVSLYTGTVSDFVPNDRFQVVRELHVTYEL